MLDIAVRPKTAWNWQPLMSMINPRKDFGMIHNKGKIYAFGGRSAFMLAGYNHPSSERYVDERNHLKWNWDSC